MLMIRETLPNGDFRLRHITRACLPEGPVPKEGRILTVEQVNDAMSLANHAMSRRREIGKAEYDEGREALGQLLGHIVAADRAMRAERETVLQAVRDGGWIGGTEPTLADAVRLIHEFYEFRENVWNEAERSAADVAPARESRISEHADTDNKTHDEVPNAD